MPDRATEDYSPIADLSAGTLTPDGLVRLQRAAGNAAVASLLAPGGDPTVQRSPKAATLEEALRTGDSDELDHFRPFSGITSNQLLSLVNLITTQAFVSWREESLLEEAWTSLGVTQALERNTYDLWKACEKRGAKAKNVPWLAALREGFRTDVMRLTRKHLATNGQLVKAEMARFGLAETPAAAAPPQTQDQGQELKLMQAAADKIADVQEQQEQARDVYVGYRVEYPQPEGKAAWVPVTFDPFNPPTRADPPPQPDVNDPNPLKDRTPVLKVVPTQSYDELLAAYNAGTESIRDLLTLHPMIYAVSREGKSSDTRTFATTADPVEARAQLGAALQRLLGDIDKAGGMLGNKLDPLDLRPVHQQLFGGMKSEGQVGDWSKQFSQQLAAEQVKDHDMSNALVALGLEALSQMAFMVSSAAPGAGGLAIMIVGLAAAGAKAHISDTQYQAMAAAAKTAVAPNTNLVEPRDVAQVKAVRDADQRALALGVINLAAAAAGALARGVQKLTGIGRRVAAGERPIETAKAQSRKVSIDPGKLDYIFGQASGRRHNIERAEGNAIEMRKLGFYNDAEARAAVRSNLEAVALDDSSITGAQRNQWGDFEGRQSFIIGPSGKGAVIDSKWQVGADGSRRLTTAWIKSGR